MSTIEVIGRDGRVHRFAEGTTQAQIDAAMADIYDTSAPPPINAPIYNNDPPVPSSYAQPAAGPPQKSISTGQIILGGIAVAAIALLVTLAFVLGRGTSPVDEAQTAGPAATAPPATASPTDTGGLSNVPAGPAVTAEAFGGFVATTRGGNLVVRSQPQSTGSELAKLPYGAPVSVTGSILMADGLWRQVSIGGALGYVKGEYISQTQPAAIARAPAPPPAVKMKPMDFMGIIVTSKSNSVNMRAEPNTNARVMTALPRDTEVRIIGQQSDWYLVEWRGKRGWVSTNFIEGFD